jgi:hypothetical protein
MVTTNQSLMQAELRVLQNHAMKWDPNSAEQEFVIQMENVTVTQLQLFRGSPTLARHVYANRHPI